MDLFFLIIINQFSGKLLIEPGGSQIPQSPGFPGLKKTAERVSG